MLQRLFTLILKELWQIRKNPTLLRMILLMPLTQMLIFGYAAVLDVKNIDLAFLDKDCSSESRDLQDTFRQSSYFVMKYSLHEEREISYLMDRGKIMAAVVIPPDFSKKINRGTTSPVQVIIDGNNTSAASAISNYSANAIVSYSNRLLKARGMDPSKLGALQMEPRFLYNPNLDNKFFFIPGIFAMIIMILGMPMTAMAIVREKEEGTMEQLIVTPMQPVELILGKVIPYALLIMVSSAGILVISRLWFHLPIRGSMLFLFMAVVLFLLNCLALGIFISTISNSQYQAILTSFFINMPMILFSGFMFPVENMPPYFRIIADINPMRYFLTCARGIFLKGTGWDALRWPLLAMAISGVILFTASILNFRKRLD